VVDARTLEFIGCTAERDVDHCRLRLERRQLAEVESALQRIMHEATVACTRCGNVICAARSKRSPAARLCGRCEARDRADVARRRSPLPDQIREAVP
jgi:RNA polymerase-binding transcription factor DksA